MRHRAKSFTPGRGNARPLHTRQQAAPDLQDLIAPHIEPQPDGCWHWTGPKRVAGDAAHRTIFSMVNGPLDHWCLHRLCATPTCVNPSHFRVGR